MAAYRRVYDSLPRTGISSGIVRSVIEYRLPLPLFTYCSVYSSGDAASAFEVSMSVSANECNLETTMSVHGAVHVDIAVVSNFSYQYQIGPITRRPRRPRHHVVLM